MPEDWLRWGIGLLVAGNAFFIVEALRRAARAHDQFLVLNEKVDTLNECVKKLGEHFGHIADIKTDIAILKFRVFGKPKGNGHDRTDGAEIDIDS